MVVFGVIDCVMRLLVSSCSFAPSQSQNVLVLFPVCVLFFFSFFRHRLFNIRVSFHYANGLCCRNQDLIGSHLASNTPTTTTTSLCQAPPLLEKGDRYST